MHTYAKRSLKITGEMTVVVVSLRVNNNNNAHQCIDIKYPSMSPKGDFQTSFESSPHFLETLKLSKVFRIPFSVAFPHLSILYSTLTFTTCIWMYSQWTHANNYHSFHSIPCVSVLQSKLNCEVLHDDLAFEVRWAVAGESIVIQLVAKLGKYMPQDRHISLSRVVYLCGTSNCT